MIKVWNYDFFLHLFSNILHRRQSTPVKIMKPLQRRPRQRLSQRQVKIPPPKKKGKERKKNIQVYLPILFYGFYWNFLCQMVRQYMYIYNSDHPVSLSVSISWPGRDIFFLLMKVLYIWLVGKSSKVDLLRTIFVASWPWT